MKKGIFKLFHILFLLLLLLIKLQCNSSNQIIYPNKLPGVTKNSILDIVSKNSKKIIVFHFWTTWCTSCIDTFQEMVDLEKEYPEITFVSISLDEQGSSGILKLSVPFNISNIYHTAEEPEKLLSVFPQTWNGGVPLVILTSGDLSNSRYFYGLSAIRQIEHSVSLLLYQSR